jgi:uncharacterized protein (TIGR02145 family)
VVPTVITDTATSITQTTATSGGEVTSSGGSSVTARGVCWSTSPVPSLADNYSIDGSGTGTFISFLTGLTYSTLYYVRAYATNIVGTAYGNEITFTTLPAALAMVTTDTATNITSSTATSGGNVTSNGGASITARGVCWSTSSNPTLAADHTIDGSGLGTFISNLTGLAENTLYYVRAYATNSVGTAYGNEITFTTNQPFQCGDQMQDIDGNTYNTVQIGSQCWMKENLKTTTYNNNTPIPNVTDANSWSNLTTGAYVWYDNDISWKDLYGALYNWYAVDDSDGLCPIGWHVPTYYEWNTLVNYIGGMGSPNGNKIKSCRQVNSPLGGDCNTSEHPRWDECDTQYGTDDYGFSGLPGGYRTTSGLFDYIQTGGFWRCSLYGPPPLNLTWLRTLFNTSGGVGSGSFPEKIGSSVRCLKN